MKKKGKTNDCFHLFKKQTSSLFIFFFNHANKQLMYTIYLSIISIKTTTLSIHQTSILSFKEDNNNNNNNNNISEFCFHENT